MNTILNRRDIVFFLGAGFSADSQYPLMKNFGSYCNEEYKNLKLHSVPDRNFRKIAPMLVESFGVFKAFQEFCRQSVIMKNDEVNNMENVFGIAEVLRESGVTYVDLDKSKYHIDELISHIQLTLWKIYQKGPLLAQKLSPNMNEIKENIYKPFFETLTEHLPRLTFITTNYDLIIEAMMSQSKYPCMYPIRNDGRENSIIAGQRTGETDEYKYVKYPLKTKDATGKIRYISHDEPILCKLHGSINFFYDSKDGNKDRILIADDLGNEKAIGNSGVWNNRPSILALDALWNLQNKYGKSITPAIIPPTYSKLAGQEWLRDIWKTAFYALLKAQKVIFVGYSFPQTDGFMRAMIQGAMAMRASNQLPEIHVIDSDPITLKRYKELFGAEVKKEYPMKLRDAIRSKVFYECIES